MVSWIWKDNEIESDYKPKESSFGFVYEITYTNGKKYVGAKQFWSTVRLKPLKTQRKNAVRTKTTMSKWYSYVGSSKLTAGLEIAKREILIIAKSKRELTYLECRELFSRKVLEHDEYLNENILGTFFRAVRS